MSHQAKNRTFWFRASAAAFGGHITSPVDETLDTQGASSAPPTGGSTSTVAGPFNYRDIVSFERATSTVAGRAAELDGRRTYDTEVTVAVEGLNVLDIVTADLVVARLTSQHPDDSGEPAMLPIGSHFKNLRLAGVEVEMALAPQLAQNGGYTALTKVCAEQFGNIEGNPNSGQDRLDLKAGEWQEGAPSPVFEDRLLLAPLFIPGAQHDYPPSGTKPVGGTGIYIPRFGSVYLGEYLISRHSRRLTMLRIMLSSDVEGEVSLGYGDINGNIYP